MKRLRASAELRRAEEALQRSEERFKLLAENVVDVIWMTDLNLRYTYLSPSIAKLRGWSAEEAAAQPFFETLVPSSLELVKSVFAEELALERQDGPTRRVRTLELELIRKDGSTVWTEVRVSFLHNDAGEPTGIIGVTRDITERLRAQAIERESEEQFRALSTAAQDAIITMDNEKRVTFWSEAAERMFGHTIKEALGKNAHDLLAPAFDGAKLAEVFPRWRETGLDAAGRTVELVAHRKDGSEFPVEISLSSTQIKGRWNAIGIIRDITRRRRAEEEARQSNDKLQALVKKLEERNVQNGILSEMREFLQACPTASEIGPVIMRSLMRLFPDSQGALFFLSPSKTDLESSVRWGGFPEDIDNNVFAPDDCWGLRRGGIYVVDDAASPLICPHLKRLPAAGYACLPLMAKGDVLGLLHIRNVAAAKGKDGSGMTAELKDLYTTLSELLSLSISNIRLREILSSQSIKDPLTGLFNRRYMEEIFQREIYRAARKQEQIGVVMIDVDHFKTFNDIHGHPAGDMALVEIANLFRTGLRKSDIACRYGGEEFTLILPECPLDEAGRIARRLAEEAKNLRVRYGGHAFGPITLSMGVAAFPQHGANPADLLRAADAALYRAKHEGRDMVILA